MEIYPGTHLIKNLFVNLFVIRGEEGLTLIDTGISGNAKNIFNYIASLGYQPENLVRILITHADGDHYGSLASLQKRVSAQTFASQIEADAIRMGKSSRNLKPSGTARMVFKLVRPLMKSQPARVDQHLVQEQVFPVLGGLQVIFTPGHTPGHISLYSPSTGILFAGDSITVSRDQLGPSSPSTTWNSELAQQSFDLQMGFKPAVICAGHGFWKKN